MTLRLLIAAGGTGGHFYPGLAVLEALRERTDVTPMFVGTPRGIEARVLPTLGESLRVLDVSPLNGVRGTALVGSIAKLPRAAWQCVSIVRGFRPDAIVSVGGYTSGPITAVALAMRIPTAVIEPNAVPGLTNRVLGKRVQRAYLTYDEAARHFAERAVRVYGNPVRRTFLTRAAHADDTRGEVPHVLVLGGSQGSRALNRVLPDAVAVARAHGARFTLTHQSGPAERDAVASAYASGAGETETVAFIDDVASAVARADLVVCRAGAGTIAELCVIGRAALYIPLPTAADDHQRRNAEAVAARGAGWCMEQRDATPEALGARVAELLRDRDTLRATETRARALARPDAATRVAEDLLGLVAERRAVVR